MPETSLARPVFDRRADIAASDRDHPVLMPGKPPIGAFGFVETDNTDRRQVGAKPVRECAPDRQMRNRRGRKAASRHVIFWQKRV